MAGRGRGVGIRAERPTTQSRRQSISVIRRPQIQIGTASREDFHAIPAGGRLVGSRSGRFHFGGASHPPPVPVLCEGVAADQRYPRCLRATRPVLLGQDILHLPAAVRWCCSSLPRISHRVSVPGPVESKTAERSIQCRRHHYSCPRPTQDISPPQLEEHDASSLIHGCGLCTVIVGTASRQLPAARGTARCTVAGGAGSSSLRVSALSGGSWPTAAARHRGYFQLGGCAVAAEVPLVPRA